MALCGVPHKSKYLAKGAEGIGLPPERITDDVAIDALDGPEHIRRLVRAAIRLGVRSGFRDLKLREHAHTLGFGGHFLTKSLRYSTTFGDLRAARRRHARSQELGRDSAVLDAWGRPEDEDLTEVRRTWTYIGWGYKTDGEGWLVATAAKRTREERQLAREAWLDSLVA